MSLNVVSSLRALAVTGVVALVVSSQAFAESRPEVVERIKPVGMVAVEGGAQPAAAAAPAAATPAPAAPAQAAAPAPAPAAPAAPADPGAALYTAKGCTACHGAEGKAPIMPVYPKVASLPEQYILNQLKDIKSGARANGQSAVMKGIMAAVSDDEMAQMAKYLSAIPR